MQQKGQLSFFDSDKVSSITTIWETVTSVPQQENVLVEAEVLKVCKGEVEKLKPITLTLTNEFLYLKKRGIILQQLYLVLTRLDVFTEPRPGFRLTRNQQTLLFYVDDEKTFLNWKKFLTSKCFQSTFHEEFVVSKMIGKGSFAKVYLATKKETGEEYAIKAFNKEFMLEQFKGKESLENEIKVMRKFNQENLVNLYEVYETVNSIYFVIDILSGGELLHRVKLKGLLNQKDLQRLMYNFMKALAYIHAKNCIHRDLKPENILLKSKDNDTDVVVADFGLAAFLDDDIIFKRCGTPGFVAPEILLYKEGDVFYDQKCDVFSAGVIFYVLITGKQPFQGSDYKQILRANKACEINFLLPQIVNSSEEMQDLIKKMLQSDPLNRISSSECLKHAYFGEIASEQQMPEPQITQENRIMYEKDYLSGLKKNIMDSQEMVGSMELQHRSPVQNGKVETIDSLSNYSNLSITKISDTPKAHGASKFSQFGQKCATQQQGSTPEGNSSPSNRQNSQNKNQSDLHKKALKNSLFNKQAQEESKKLDDDINEENPGLSQAMDRFKQKEGQARQFKSASNNQSPNVSPRSKVQ